MIIPNFYPKTLIKNIFDKTKNMIYTNKYILKEQTVTQVAKVFQNGRSQAIRIPKELELIRKRLYRKIGDTFNNKDKSRK